MVLGKLSRGTHLAFLLAVGIAYAAYSIRRQPPGITRLLMSLPVLLLFTLAPLQFEQSAIVSGSLGFLFGWLGNFKLLAYSADRGPLAYPGLGVAQWLLLLLLPYFPARRGHQPARAVHVALSLAFKVALGAAVTVFLLSPLGEAHRLLRHAGYALYVWLWASLLLDGPMPAGCHLLGGCIPLQPAMANPFASTSLREFWGRRYNQIVSAILRDTVYEPILEGRWVATRGSSNPHSQADGLCNEKYSTASSAASNAGYGGPCRRPAVVVASSGDGVVAAAEGASAAQSGGKGGRASPAAVGGGGSGKGDYPVRRPKFERPRRWVGLCATFAVSGVMHEVCMMYMCGGRLEGSFRMMGFFLLQPLLILGQDAAGAAVAKLVPERFLLRGSNNWRAVAAGLRTAVTLALVLGSAEWFWGPLEACRTDERGLAEVMGAMRWLAARARAVILLLPSQ